MKDICIISTDFHANTNAYWRKKTLESIKRMKDSDYFNHDASHIDGREDIIDFSNLKEYRVKKINLPKLLEYCRRGSRRDLTYQKTKYMRFDYYNYEKKVGKHAWNLRCRLGYYKKNMYRPHKSIKFHISVKGFAYTNKKTFLTLEEAKVKADDWHEYEERVYYYKIGGKCTLIENEKVLIDNFDYVLWSRLGAYRYQKDGKWFEVKDGVTTKT